MDFLDPRKKRAHLIRLYVGYALMVVAVIIASIVLLYTSYGYGVDRHTGKVIQNGLVFVSSSPNGADVNVVDSTGKKQPQSQTDTRLTIPAGQYTVTLTKKDYRAWKRDIMLDGGSVERLMYPLLFPNTLVTKDAELYANQPTLITNSPDRHWILVLKERSVSDFDMYDANTKDPSPKPISIPPALLTPGQNQSLKIVEWSTDNKHVLLMHSYDDKHEFILFNREAPNESINIDKTFNVPPAQVALYDKGADQVYLLLTDGSLQQAQIKDKKTTLLLSNVINFKPHGSDMIEYISSESVPKDGKVSVKLRTNDANYVLRELPANTTYVIDIARFDNRWYVVAGAASENKVYVYQDPLDVLRQKNPTTNVPARTMRVENPQKVSFSANTRFIAAQGGKQFAIYDAEADRQYRYGIDKNLDSEPASWMDGDRLTSVADGHVIVWDFDGSNQQTLNSAFDHTSPVFDREYTAMYTLAPSSQVNGRFALSRTSLRVE